MKLKLSESKLENRFSKNEIRNSRFPKIFKNRFENSESVLERMIYKNALKKKTNHNFEKMITQDDLWNWIGAWPEPRGPLVPLAWSLFGSLDSRAWFRNPDPWLLTSLRIPWIPWSRIHVGSPDLPVGYPGSLLILWSPDPVRAY